MRTITYTALVALLVTLVPVATEARDQSSWQISATVAPKHETTSPATEAAKRLPEITNVGEALEQAGDNTLLFVLVEPTGRCNECLDEEQRVLTKVEQFPQIRFVRAKIGLFHLRRAVVPGVYVFTPGKENPTFAQPNFSLGGSELERFLTARIAFFEKRKELVHSLDLARKALGEKQVFFAEQRQLVLKARNEDLSEEIQALVRARNSLEYSPPIPGLWERLQASVQEAQQELEDASAALGYDRALKGIDDRMKEKCASELARVAEIEAAIESADRLEYASWFFTKA
jgi:hypothetical protein